MGARRSSTGTRLAAGVLALWSLTVGAGGAAAQAGIGPRPPDREVAAFYGGRTVRLVVGFTAGGGFDVYSRLIARHLGRHIPGQPAVLVENMPGAASIVAANHLYNVAPRDGTVIGNVSGAIILEQLFANPAVQFDMARFRHLAVPVAETFVMLAARRAGVTRIDEVIGPGARPLVVGTIPGSTVGHAALLVRDVLGANLKVVSGYKGTSEIRMAIESGEVDAFFNSWASARVTVMDRLRSGEWLVLAQLGDTPLPGLPAGGVPTIPELARTEEARQLLRFGTNVPNAFGKLYALPPGVPEERAAAVEAAFARTLTDPAFLADAERARIEIAPLSGEQVRRLVLEFLAMAPELRVKLQAAMKPGRR
jgi:tripartite-type tricarboxylate transporter receptor subunit TctC